MATNKAQIELTAVDKTRVAIQSAQRGLEGLNRSADSIQRSLAGLGGLISLGAFVSFAKGAVSAAAALDDMAEATGATVEGLSKLTTIARIGGTDIGQVETALIRLNKALFQQDEESSDAARALNAVGLAAADLRAQSPDQALESVARAFARFEAGASKTAAAVALFGRSGAQLLPLLKDIAEQGDAVASVTAQQAAEAEKFEKELRRLSVTAENFGRSVTLDLVRGLNAMREAFSKNRIEMGGWRAAYVEVAKLINATLSDLPGPIGRAAQEQADFLFGITKGRESGGKIGAAALEQQIAQLRALADATRGQVPFAPKSSGPGGSAADEKFRRPLADLQTTEASIESILADLSLERRKELEKMREQMIAIIEPGQRWLDQLNQFNAVADELNLTADQIERIRDAFRERIDEEQFGKPLKDVTEELQKQKTLAEELGLTFTSAFEDAIVGGKGLSDVLRGLEQDILRLVTRKLITEPFGEAISGAIKGSGIFDGLGSLFGSLIPKFDTGTPYVPRDMLAVVHRGEAIIPAARNRGGAGNVVINISTPDAASFRASEAQITAQAARMLARAQRVM